jgi:hypothetical protein
MITSAQDAKRLIPVTAGNIRNRHVSVTGLRDFLPKDCFGGPRKGQGRAGNPIRIELDGLGKTIETDVGTEPKTGKPRRQFRRRDWVRAFFHHHGVSTGDVLEIERLGDRLYRLGVAVRQGDDSQKPLRVAEFFAGIGLVRLALQRHGMKVIYANDIDPDKQEMYEANFGAEHFHRGDIHKIDVKELPDCDLFTASFPCNDLSIAGSWSGLSGKQSSAFWGLIRILKDLGPRRPPIVMLENVVGFLQSNGGKEFEAAMLALNELGYAVDAFFLDAARFVPQSSLRLFVVGKLGVAGECPWALGLSELQPGDAYLGEN